VIQNFIGNSVRGRMLVEEAEKRQRNWYGAILSRCQRRREKAMERLLCGLMCAMLGGLGQQRRRISAGASYGANPQSVDLAFRD